MGDGDMKTEEGAILVDAPDLGARVELVEGNVGDALRLIDVARTQSHFVFLMEALAVSLRIDGRRFTADELRAMPGRKTRALLALGPQAINLNSFFEPGADTEDDEPKS